MRGVSIQSSVRLDRRTLFAARPKTRFRSSSRQNPAQAEAEDGSKIKDRWEALLFAETLQGTLSPNANPGKGSIGGFTELDAESHREDSAGSSDTPVTCPLLYFLYQTARHCARGESKKLLRGVQGDFWARGEPDGDARLSIGRLPSIAAYNAC